MSSCTIEVTETLQNNSDFQELILYRNHSDQIDATKMRKNVPYVFL